MKRCFLLVSTLFLLPLLSNAQDTISTFPANDSTQSDSIAKPISESITDLPATDSIIKTISPKPYVIATDAFPLILPKTSERNIYPEMIAVTPDANIISLISATRGVVNGNGSLYFRGSRSDEIAYFIDGFNVTEQYTGEMATPINLAAIKELSIVTGSWGVEYGNAMGGLVNFKTKEYNDKFNVFGKWTIEPGSNNNKIETSVSGALPIYNEFSYLLSAETDNGNDIRPCFMPDKYYVHDPSKDYFWADTLQYSYATWDTTDTVGLDNWSGDWADSTDGAWQEEKEKRMANGWVHGWKEDDESHLPHSDYNKYRLLGKIHYKIEPLDAKISLLGVASRDQNAEYSAGWKYNLDGYYSSLQKSNLLGLTWEHKVLDKIHYTLKISRHHSQTQLGTRDTLAEKDRGWWEDYTFLSDGDADGDSMYDAYEGQAYSAGNADNPYGVAGIFYTSGLAGIWEKTFSDRNTQKLDIRSEHIKNNCLSAGLEFNQHHVYRKYNYLPWDPAPIKGFYEYEPKTMSYYFQDEYTHNKFFIAAGLRFDHVDLADYFQSKYYYFEDKIITYEQKKNATSLRTNVGYSLTPSASFSLGFNQYSNLPSWDMLYNAYLPWLYSLPIFVDFQKTTSYEAGITNNILHFLTINTNVYYKKINNVFQSRTKLDSLTGLMYIDYSYADYGTAKGMEIGLKYDWEYFSGDLNYSYSKAVFSTEDDKAEIVLNYDQTNKFNIVTNFNSGKNFGPKVAGFHPLSDITIGLTNDFGTGFPFSRTDLKGMIIGNLNDSLLPSYWYTNLLVSKKIDLHKIAMSLNLEVLNLFNRKNIAGLYSTTGEVNWDGKVITLDDFSSTAIPDSIAYTVDGNGIPVMVPNPYYSKWRDLNRDGQIDQNEKYLTYAQAWNDYISDPFNSTRVPYDRAYMAPRRFKFSLSISF
jgi:hypothetical protein